MRQLVLLLQHRQSKWLRCGGRHQRALSHGGRVRVACLLTIQVYVLQVGVVSQPYCQGSCPFVPALIFWGTRRREMDGTGGAVAAAGGGGVVACQHTFVDSMCPLLHAAQHTK